MPLILNEEEGKLLGKKQVIVPKKLVDKLRLNKNLFGKYKDTKGFKRVSAIVDDDYNKRSNKKDKIHTDDKTISFSDLKRIDHDMRHTNPNPHNLEYILPGGDDMKTWAHDTLRKLRTSVKKVKTVPPVPKLEKEPTKPKNIQKDVKMGNATVRLTENLDVFYDDYFERYGATYVFDSFLDNPNGKQNWGPLINPDMYAKALGEFTKYGELINFPSKYVYQWMGIIMKNTSTLIANTEICGHGTCFPEEECEEFLMKYYNDNREIIVYNYNNIEIEIFQDDILKMCEECGIVCEAVDKHGQTYFPWVTQADVERIIRDKEQKKQKEIFGKTHGDLLKYINAFNEKNKGPYNQNLIFINYETNKFYWRTNADEVLSKIGIIGKWMTMPDGSDGISDYGIEPIMNILEEYDENLPPEKVLVLVNKVLDVYHRRGDLSSIFIQGGSKSLSAISEELKRGKKIIVSENQLLTLKEYRSQQVFNFDDNGEPYYKKDNWQHYIDFLEKIGKYGQLPPSEWDENDIRNAVEEEKENLDPDGYDSGVNEYEQFVSFSDLACETIVMNKYKKEDIFEPTFLDIFEQGYEAFKENNNYYHECETITKYLESLDLDKSNLDDYLTVYGYKCFTKTLRDNYYDNQYDYGFIDSFTFNDRGLLYIERNIKIPKFNSPDIDDKGFKDFFAKLNHSYYGIGTCFSWREGKGESYCGSGESELKLKCWVDPKNVNWYETLQRNCYSLREEQEIYIDSDNAVIEVFDIVLEHGKVNGINVSGKSLLKSPILVGV